MMKSPRPVIAGLLGFAMLAGLAACQGTTDKMQLEPGAAPAVTPKVAGDMVAVDDLHKLGLRRYWQRPLDLVPGDRVRLAGVFGEHLVVLTERNMLFRIDSRGIVDLIREVERPDRPGLFPPTFDGTRFYFAGKVHLLGLNAKSGDVDVNIKLELPASAPAVSDKKFVYSGALDGRVFAYSIESQVLHWPSKVAAAVTSLGFSHGMLIVARSDLKNDQGQIMAIRPGIWEEAWRRNLDGPITAPIVCTDESIFVAGQDRSLYRFDPAEGWLVWRTRTPGVLNDSPVLLKDRLVQKVPSAGTWVVTRTMGKLIWKDPAPLDYLGTVGQNMYFFNGQSLVCKEGDSGRTLGTVPVNQPDLVQAVANTSGDRIYLVNVGGQIICCSDLGQPYLTIDELNR